MQSIRPQQEKNQQFIVIRAGKEIVRSADLPQACYHGPRRIRRKGERASGGAAPPVLAKGVIYAAA